MLGPFDQIGYDLISQFVNESRVLLIDSQRSKGLLASGKSAAALQVTIRQDFGQLIDSAGYFYFQEFGRKPGKMPPFKAIYDWLEFNKYGFTYSSEKDRIRKTFAIMNSIRKKGTYTHQNGQTNVVSDVVNQNRINSLLQSMAAKYKATAKSDIVQTFKPN